MPYPVSYLDLVSETFENGDHLPSTFRLWPDEQDGPWLIVFFWQLISGRVECVGVDLTSTRSPHVAQWYPLKQRPEIGTPLRTSTLRDLRLSELVADERANMDAVLSDDEQRAWYTQPPTNMRPATVLRLQLVADTYRAAWRKGQPPVKSVAKRLNVTNSAATGLVARARAAGLLPPTSPGVAVGEPTEDGEA